MEQGDWKLVSEVGWDKSREEASITHLTRSQARFQAMWDSSGLFRSTQTGNQKRFRLSLI